MLIPKLLTSAAALSLAGTVTVGSMYVTLDAAVAPQEQTSAPVLSTPVPAVDSVESADPQVLQKRSHDVALHPDGSLTGQLSRVGGADGGLVPAADVEVRLIRQGRTVAFARTNAEGQFSASGLLPGAHALVASGENGYAAYGLRLVPSSESSEANDKLHLLTAVTNPRDFPIIKRLISERFQPVIVAGRTAPNPVTALPQMGPITYGAGEAATTIHHHQVQLTPEGSLTGQINTMDPADGHLDQVSDLTVYFIADNTLIASARVNPDGSFVVAGLTPGLFSVVAVGADGVLAFGVDVMGAGIANAGEFKLTSILEMGGLAGATVSPTNFASVVEPPGTAPGVAPPEGALPAPFGGPMGSGMMGGGGGAMGGGGAAGGGGGGLGLLLGGAAGAALGWAIADSNDDSPASP